MLDGASHLTKYETGLLSQLSISYDPNTHILKCPHCQFKIPFSTHTMDNSVRDMLTHFQINCHSIKYCNWCEEILNVPYNDHLFSVKHVGRSLSINNMDNQSVTNYTHSISKLDCFVNIENLTKDTVLPSCSVSLPHCTVRDDVDDDCAAGDDDDNDGDDDHDAGDAGDAGGAVDAGDGGDAGGAAGVGDAGDADDDDDHDGDDDDDDDYYADDDDHKHCYKCLKCGLVYKQINGLIRHKRTHLAPKYHCSMCDNKFVQLEEKYKHEYRMHKLHPKIWECPHCSIVEEDSKKRVSHRRHFQETGHCFTLFQWPKT